MLAGFNDLFDKTNQLLPYGACLLWVPALVNLNVLADAVMGLSYYSLPFVLWYFIRKRKGIIFPWVYLAAFIFLCGTTHFVNIWTLWFPDYWFSGGVKLFNAMVSLMMLLLVCPKLPGILGGPVADNLKNNEILMRAIFNASPDAMLISDKDDVITMINQRAEVLFGYPADELIGQKIQVLVPERFRVDHVKSQQRFADIVSDLKSNPERWFTVQCKAGNELDVDISLSPINTDQGDFFQALCVIFLNKKIRVGSSYRCHGVRIPRSDGYY